MANSLTNQLLIAMPQLKNTAFGESVIYMCQDDQNGAMGLIINHPIQETLKKVFEELEIDHGETHHSILNFPIHIGGPVRSDNIFVLHTIHEGREYENTILVQDGLAVTTSMDILEEIADNCPPDGFLVLAGYSSWAKNQLADEIKENDWLSIHADHKIVFNLDSQEKWQTCLQNIGVHKPSDISTQYGHA